MLRKKMGLVSLTPPENGASIFSGPKQGRSLTVRSGLFHRKELQFCQTCSVARRLPAKRVERVGHCPRGAQRKGPKAAKRLPPCHRASFCDARQTIAVHASRTFINSLRSRLPHVSRHAGENNLHPINFSHAIFLTHALSLSLPPCFLT